MNNNMENQNIQELTYSELKMASGGASGISMMPICCNPTFGGCGHIQQVSMSATKWICKICRKSWSIDG